MQSRVLWLLSFINMTCLLTDIPFDVKLHLLSYCDAITVLVRISSLSRSLRAICLKNDDIWKEHCHHLGISNKLFKEVSWVSNYKYVVLHMLRSPA